MDETGTQQRQAPTWRDHFPFASHWVELSRGERLHYVDEGAGPNVLLVHGNPTWSFYFRKLITDLRNDCRVLAVDHIGCGLSDKPDDYDYCLARHTDNLLEFVDQRDLSEITVLGHDWGGAIALNAVRREPGRFQRIVLCNTGAFPPPRVPCRIAVCRIPVVGPVAVRGFNLFVRGALRMALTKPSILSSAERNGILAPYDNWAHRIGIWKFIADIPMTRRHRTWQELEQLERALGTMTTIPRLLIWGMQDWCFDPSCLARFQCSWPDAEVETFADAGHWVVEEKPREIAARLRHFLQQTQCGPSTVPASTPAS